MNDDRRGDVPFKSALDKPLIACTQGQHDRALSEIREYWRVISKAK